MKSCYSASREHRFPSDWHDRECWEDRKHRRGSLERQRPPLNSQAPLIRERKDCLEIPLQAFLCPFLQLGWCRGRSTLLEELRYAISLSGGREEKKHSVIVIAAIVGYQLTRLLPCLCVLTRLSKSRDPRPRNKSQLIPLSRG